MTYYPLIDWKIRSNSPHQFCHHKKSFFKERLQASLVLSDLLNTASDFYYSSDYGGQIVNGIRSFDNRRIGISATCKFGNQKLKTGKKSKSAMDDELKMIGE